MIRLLQLLGTLLMVGGLALPLLAVDDAGTLDAGLLLVAPLLLLGGPLLCGWGVARWRRRATPPA